MYESRVWDAASPFYRDIRCKLSCISDILHIPATQNTNVLDISFSPNRAWNPIGPLRGDLILSLRHVCDCEILIFRALIKNRVVSCWSMLFSHTIVRLTTRSLSRPLYSARYCSQISGVSAIPTMAVQQPAWTLPTRKTDEPVLKVYNSLTRTKVNKCSLVSLVSNVLTESGIDGVRAIYWEPCEVV